MYTSNKNHLNIPWDSLPILDIHPHYCCELISDDMKKTYPDLPLNTSWTNHNSFVKKRKAYLYDIDSSAEKKINFSFKTFLNRFIT